MPLSGIFLSYQKVPLLPYQGSTASLHFSFSLSFYFYFYFYFLFYAQHSLVTVFRVAVGTGVAYTPSVCT